jgi:hypothetical protein
MAHSEYMKLPRWERTMYKVYIDVKVKKQQHFDERMKAKQAEAAEDSR